MHQAVGMRLGQPLGDAARQESCLHDVDPAAGRQLGQVLAFDVFHDQPIAIAAIEHVVNANDGRVIEAGHSACLAQKPLALHGIGRPDGEHLLDRHMPLKDFIPGQKNFTHAAAAEQGLDAVNADLLVVWSFGERDRQQVVQWRDLP